MAAPGFSLPHCPTRQPNLGRPTTWLARRCFPAADGRDPENAPLITNGAIKWRAGGANNVMPSVFARAPCWPWLRFRSLARFNNRARLPPIEFGSLVPLSVSPPLKAEIGTRASYLLPWRPLAHLEHPLDRLAGRRPTEDTMSHWIEPARERKAGWLWRSVVIGSFGHHLRGWPSAWRADARAWIRGFPPARRFAPAPD